MLDSEKYKAAVHYIIASCDDPIKLGSIKLNKILFYSDSDMFFNTGKSITNDEYIKRQFGPVPKNILEILKGKNITIPYILIKNMDELKISYKSS